MLEFQNPEYLYALILVPVIAFLFVLLHRWRKGLLARFASPSVLKQLAPEMSAGKRALKQTLLLLGLTFIILAFANPQVGTRLEEVKREGIDMFVALDVSLSMKAEDIRPSRLEKAKRDVSSLLAWLMGDRVGLIVFAGDAFIQFPLTSDYSAADLFISAVDVDVVPLPGTMIATAIEKALESFPQESPAEKAIIIVSDGENTEGDIMGAVEKATNASVKIFTVGMGTPEGGPIPIVNDRGERVDFKRDRNGSIVLTRLDESTLRQIAASTGGSYRRATSGGNEIDEIFQKLSELEKVEFGVKQVTGFESKYEYPLVLAILFLLIELILSERRGVILVWLRRFLPATACVLLVIGAGSSEGSAQTHRGLIEQGNGAFKEGKYADAEAEYKKALENYPSSKEARFNLGAAYYRQGRYDEAAESYGVYSGAVRNPEEQSAAYYNIGNSSYKRNKFKESIEAYKEALRLNPRDDDARYNLQLAMEKLKQQQRQPQNNQRQDQQKQKQQQQDQQEQQQQEQQQRQEQQQQQKSSQDQVGRKNQIPRDQADRILEALRNNEKEIQKQIRKREGVRTKTEKDW